MIKTPFGSILQRAVENTPGAIGGAFSASDGELVDSWTDLEEGDWAIVIATYGITISHVRSALHTFHFGDVKYIHVSHEKLEILAQIIADKYFVLIAVEPPVHLLTAERNLQQASDEILLEMK